MAEIFFKGRGACFNFRRTVAFTPNAMTVLLRKLF